MQVYSREKERKIKQICWAYCFFSGISCFFPGIDLHYRYSDIIENVCNTSTIYERDAYSYASTIYERDAYLCEYIYMNENSTIE